MRFGESFLEELKARVRPSDVIGKHVKLRRQGREFAGLSPFTNEKTPSFFVNDQKGFYHCFSSGKHGDAISFLMEVEGLTFPEAVESLASMAGMDMPKADPKAAARAEARAEQAKVLVNWMERAQTYFQRSLFAEDGAQARSYLKSRGLDKSAVKEFGLGFAPNRFDGLKGALTAEGAQVGELLESGLLVEPEEGDRDPWDRFRDRVMFPIHDARGRLVAFGGRALSKEARAKYLNSPETPLFQKRELLYNFHRARPVAADPKTEARGLIVVEGYMDVIALVRAGFAQAVAPLGTALGEAQLRLLWRAGDTATLCFDGDSAGLRAAYRSVEEALPHLRPGRTLRFALLPKGKDPDDLIRDQGREAMREVLNRAVPLVDMLWTKLEAEADTATPEGKAALKSSVFEALKSIADAEVRRQYQTDLLARFDKAHGWAAQRGGGRNMGTTPTRLTPRMKAAITPDALRENRERQIAGALLEFPVILERVDAEFFALPLQSGLGRDLQTALLGYWRQNLPVDKSKMRAHMQAEGLGDHLSTLALKRRDTVAAVGGEDGDPDTREALWRDLVETLTGQDAQSQRRENRSRLAETLRGDDTDGLKRAMRARRLSSGDASPGVE